MKILLTGYTGLLGRHVAKYLKAEGYWVRVLLHAKTVTRREITREVDEYLFGAMDDEKVIRQALEGIDCVIHCGWKFNPNGVLHPTINEKAIELLFNESENAHIKRFAYISSIAVYGMQGRAEKIIETNQLAQGEELIFTYPKEKILIENMLATKFSNQMFIGIFRPGPIFDDRKSPIKKIVPFIGKKLGIGFGNGKNIMPLIHADDVANAILLWIRDNKPSNIFNITPDRDITYKEWFKNWGKVHNLNIKPVFIRGSILIILASFATLVKRILGKKGKVDVSYVIAAATRNLSYSNNKAKLTLGWEPVITQKYIDN
ncbi:MAG: NAD-dependent epimerase/dehydratase family protein [Ignavibacteriaceae bacterium]